MYFYTCFINMCFLNMCLTDVVIFPVYALNCKDEMSSPFLNTKKRRVFLICVYS